MSTLRGNLTLDPTLPAWTSALVIYEALPPEAQARFLLGPLDTFDAVMRTAVASGVPQPRHASGRRLTWRGPGWRAAHAASPSVSRPCEGCGRPFDLMCDYCDGDEEAIDTEGASVNG